MNPGFANAAYHRPAHPIVADQGWAVGWADRLSGPAKSCGPVGMFSLGCTKQYGWGAGHDSGLVPLETPPTRAWDDSLSGMIFISGLLCRT